MSNDLGREGHASKIIGTVELDSGGRLHVMEQRSGRVTLYAPLPGALVSLHLSREQADELCELLELLAAPGPAAALALSGGLNPQ